MTGRDSDRHEGDIVRDCGELATAIAAARLTVAGGGPADLEPLVDRLALLIEAVDGIPRAERADLLPQLLGLAEEIEALGDTIAAECRRCSAELAKGEVSARAAAAYAKTDLN